jgi:cellulose biosynthesis protein BcsQ
MATVAPGKIVTFYSYKGGTGRSMALANAAWILAANGYRVLAVDWDLEAPGLHRYFAPFLLDQDLTATDGIIDFVREFEAAALVAPKRAKEVGEEPNPQWYKPLAVLGRYAVRLNFDFGPGGGHLDFVPAGRQGSYYSERVNAFDWKNFYDRLGGGAFLEAAKEDVRLRYDYILIDSRTGVSDTSGICTVQMPQILVVFFTASNQSMIGAAAVANSVRRQQAAHRKGSEPDVRVLPVLTRLELSLSPKMEKRRKFAEKLFDPFLDHIAQEEDRKRYWGRVQTKNYPFYVYEEVLATIKDNPYETGSLLESMKNLVNEIIGRAGALEVKQIPDQERERVLALYETDAAAPAQSAQSQEVQALPQRKHIVLTVSGVRCPYDWPNRLKQMLNGTGESAKNERVEFQHHRMGVLALLQLAIPLLFEHRAAALTRGLERIIKRSPDARIDVVAHGLGTYWIGRALPELSENQRPKIHTLVLAGSVLRSDYPWHQLRTDGIVSRIVNECGTKDWHVIMLAIVSPSLGISGRLGLTGMSDPQFQNRYHRFGHRGFFRDGQEGWDFMRRHWLPLLTTNETPTPIDERPKTPGFWLIFFTNGGIGVLRILLLILVVLGSVGAIYFLRPRSSPAPAEVPVRVFPAGDRSKSYPREELSSPWIRTLMDGFDGGFDSGLFVVKGEPFEQDYQSFRARLGIRTSPRVQLMWMALVTAGSAAAAAAPSWTGVYSTFTALIASKPDPMNFESGTWKPVDLRGSLVFLVRSGEGERSDMFIPLRSEYTPFKFSKVEQDLVFKLPPVQRGDWVLIFIKFDAPLDPRLVTDQIISHNLENAYDKGFQ